MEARDFAIAECGRLFGIPPHLLNDIEKQSSWGTGVAEQNLGLARYTLKGWSSRIEQALTRELPPGQFVEFDYAGLLQGTPEKEIRLLIEQKDAGILTLPEVRRIRNLPPLSEDELAADEARRQPTRALQEITA
jgi:phage portal protein BeeE